MVQSSSDVFTNLPGREQQIQELLNLLGDHDEPLPNSIFVSGNTATGKTACVDAVLNYLGYNHVFINCIECYSPRIMYETIIAGLQEDFDDEAVPKCDSMKDFVQALGSIHTDPNRYEPIVLVLDKAEKLRAMDSTIISTFVRLREFCNLNVCTIFITDLIYGNFFIPMGLREPMKMYFPNYSKEELFNIIFLHHKSFADYVISHSEVVTEVRDALKQPDLFGNFLNAFLSVFYRPCRDLIELRHMARVNFVKYCEPIVQYEIQPTDLSRLWRHIAPILKSSLEHLYLRLNVTPKATASVSNSPGKENMPETTWYVSGTEMDIEKKLSEELTSTKVFAQSFELPYYTKYLLVAAYLASYNPPKEDKRLFMKYHGKQRKRMQQVRAKAKISEKLNTQLGPKVFTLDRLLAIFYAILEDKIGLTSNLQSQVATLVELRLLTGGKEIDLDMAKYKCLVSYDFIVAIAQTVGFNVRKYLYDFM